MAILLVLVSIVAIFPLYKPLNPLSFIIVLTPWIIPPLYLYSFDILSYMNLVLMVSEGVIIGDVIIPENEPFKNVSILLCFVHIFV